MTATMTQRARYATVARLESVIADAAGPDLTSARFADVGTIAAMLLAREFARQQVTQDSARKSLDTITRTVMLMLSPEMRDALATDLRGLSKA
jgi:hypothetical protein